MNLINPYLHAWTQGHTNVHVFILMLTWFACYIKSLFSATCVHVTPTASYHPTGLEDNLFGMAIKEERKITNKKEWGVKTAVSLVMPNHHQPKPYDQVAHNPGSSPNKM